MRKLLVTLAVLGLAWSAAALDKAGLDQKAQKLLARFEAMQAKPDRRVPPDILNRARAVILLDRTKAGFVFAYQGGAGLAMAKDKRGKWSPIAFMKADEASLGFQIGGQQTFLVILLMNDESARTLIADAAFEWGGEARGTAGDVSSGVEGKMDDIQRAVMVYDERHGLFGGAAIKGGAISPDHEANLVYYSAAATMQDILFDKKFKPTEPAVALAKAFERNSKAGK